MPASAARPRATLSKWIRSMAEVSGYRKGHASRESDDKARRTEGNSESRLLVIPSTFDIRISSFEMRSILIIVLHARHPPDSRKARFREKPSCYARKRRC